MLINLMVKLSRCVYLLLVFLTCFSNVFGQAVIQFGTSSNDVLSDVASDVAGNIYAVATLAYIPNSEQANVVVRHYDTTGVLIYETAINSDGDDFGVSVVLAGEVLYVAGYTSGALAADNLGLNDVFISQLKKDTGELLWTRQFGTAENDLPKDLLVDEDGNLYVLGTTGGSLSRDVSGRPDAFLRKYDATGEVLWTRQFGSAHFDVAYSAVMKGEQIIVLARVGEDAQDKGVAVLYTFSDKGEVLSSQNMGRIDFHGDMQIDLQNRVFIATKYHQCLYMVCTESKSMVTLQSLDGTLNLDLVLSGLNLKKLAFPVKLALDSEGNIYLASSVFNITIEGEGFGKQDNFVRKYSAQGDVIWTKQFGTSEGETVNGLTLDNQGNVIVTGTTAGALVGDNLGGGDAYMIWLEAETGELR